MGGEPQGWTLGGDGQWRHPDLDDVETTQAMPAAGERVDYAGAVDWTSTVKHVPDVGDLVTTTAPDPTPDEITDPRHPDHVEPYTDATPVGEA